MPSLCLEGYRCWQRLGWCWIWLKCADHSLSMPILAVLKMKLASRMTVSVNYHCLCLQLTTFSRWQVLLIKKGLIASTWFLFFFPKASYQDMLKWKYCHSDCPQKLLRATKPLVPLRLKNLAPSHLVLRGKASQMICDHRNFTLGQLEAGCWPAMSWLLTAETEQLLSGHVLCTSGCQLLRGQKCRRGSDLLFFRNMSYMWERKQQRQQRPPSCKSGRQDSHRRRTSDDRRMSKPVLLVMRRKGEKMEEKRVWKHCGKGR